MAIDKEKQRARWKRNKRAQRALQKALAPLQRPIDAEFAELVWKERDKRLNNFPWYLPRLPDGRHYKRHLNQTSYPFVCDVWAALTLLESQNPGKNISTGKIAKWLEINGRIGAFTIGSVRMKVRRARPVIKFLEDAPARNGLGRYWPNFPKSVADHGSGVVQHVEDVLRYLELSGLLRSQESDQQVPER
jgi:hypothetical protein